MTAEMDTRPGSTGEHSLQERYGTFKRAAAFYDKQMLDHLNPLMCEYLARQEMVFIATADAHGECDASFRAGPPGFVRVLDDRTVMYPEYRGNGVMASLGNITENGHVGMVFVDFFHSGVGLHINGRARIIEHEAVRAFAPMLARMAGVEDLHEDPPDKNKRPERWVLVDIVEAYIHCSKHIPILAKLPGNAGEAPPSGDHFKAKDESRPWRAAGAAVPDVPDDRHDDPPGGTPVDDPGVPEPAAPARAVQESPLDELDLPAPVRAAEAETEELDFLVPPAWDSFLPH